MFPSFSPGTSQGLHGDAAAPPALRRRPGLPRGRRPPRGRGNNGQRRAEAARAAATEPWGVVQCGLSMRFLLGKYGKMMGNIGFSWGKYRRIKGKRWENDRKYGIFMGKMMVTRW